MWSKLGEILVREGYITEEQLSEALLRQSQEGGLLGSILIRMGVAHREEISRMLTRKYGVPSIDLSQVEIDPELAQLVREEIARQYRVVPVSRARGCIVLAMVDPTNISVIDELRFLTGFGIEPMVASEAAVLQKIDAYYATKLGEKFASDPRVAAFPAKTWSRFAPRCRAYRFGEVSL